MKHVYETFTDEEHKALKQIKGKTSWHDFIMERTTLVAVATEGIVVVDATCPLCGNRLVLNVQDLVSPKEVKPK